MAGPSILDTLFITDSPCDDCSNFNLCAKKKIACNLYKAFISQGDDWKKTKHDRNPKYTLYEAENPKEYARWKNIIDIITKHKFRLRNPFKHVSSIKNICNISCRLQLIDSSSIAKK